MKQALPQNLTSYDLLKTFAVLTMVVDHIGLFFFPEDLWWRAVGRLSAPAWMFLIGYARSRDLPWVLWGGGLVLLLSSLVLGQNILPLSILWGIILVRLFIDRLAAFAFADKEFLILTFCIGILLFFPSVILFDYGTACFMLALAGYALRHTGKHPVIANEGQVRIFVAIVAVIYAVGSCFMYPFDMFQQVFVLIATLYVWLVLYHFKPLTYEEDMPIIIKWPLQLCGRHSLAVYVGHLLLFKVIAFLIGVKGTGLFGWSWF